MRLKKQYLLILTLIFSLLLAMQDNRAQDVAIADTELPPDSIPADSIPSDSIPAPNAIEAPINYQAKDSMVMVMDGVNFLYLFGEGNVDYTNLNLTGEYIEIDADNSLIYSTFGLDSIGEEFGYPVFKEGETEYEMKKARYNFKTKKMYITDVITQQGDGFIVAQQTKKMPNDDLYMKSGRYTTCDDHDHPHFYLQLTKAKVRPGKNVVTGPAYLVVEDVPLPIALPFAFFPFTSDYSSGVIMPSYDDELRRGFSLRDGGYYFAFNDYVDLALTGEIFTKGSWGLNVASTYRKRYKFSGNLQANYRYTRLGDRKEDPDYSTSKDFKISWSHSQDSKAHPFRTFSANVQFSTASYAYNDVTTQYSPNATDNTKSSTINYSYRFPDSPFTLNANLSVNQTTRDSTLSVTLPNLTLTMRDIYPFKRKEQVGGPRWYESIRMNYSMNMKNSLKAKENEFFKKNIIKDWSNGMQHQLSVSATFNLLKYISITPSFNYNENWYTSRAEKEYNMAEKEFVDKDPDYGFYRVYNFSGSIGLNTKLYGFFKPWKIFGNKAHNTIIRHVITPTVSFSGAPDFSRPRYGSYKEVAYLDSGEGIYPEKEIYSYSPYQGQIFSPPSSGQAARLSFNIDNNIEMKVPIADTDSTRKISLIDKFSFGWGYNFLADSMKWDQEVSANLRLKFSQTFSINLNGRFDMYLYDEKGNRMNKLRITGGKGLGRLMSTGTSFSYSLSNTKIKEWLGKGKDDKTDEESGGEGSDPGDLSTDGLLDSPIGGEGERTSLRQKKKQDENLDSDGYWLTDIPWTLNFNCSLNIGYDRRKFNEEKREYGYIVTPTFGMSGNISPTKNWSFNFNADYDFEAKKLSRMTCTVTRQMHCWQMSASIIPVGPYQSYHFTIAVSSSMLRDLKYTQSSSNRDAMNWGNQ